MNRPAIFLLSLMIPTAVSAGPFGISQGDKIDDLKILQRQSGNIFTVEVPQPNSNFEIYKTFATPQYGVCAIWADTKNFGSWEEARKRRDDLAKALSKYGKPFRVKTDGRYETLSVRPPNDAYDLEWRKIPPPLKSITLEVSGGSFGQTVRVTYFFRNFSQCRNSVPKVDSRGL